MTHGIISTSVQNSRASLLGVFIVWLFSIPGILFSIIISVVKFRSEYHCNESLISACQVGSVSSCDAVLSSNWSTLFNIPITNFSAIFFFITFALASIILVRPTMQALLQPILLVFGWFSLFVSLVFLSYSTFALRSICLYCILLHCVDLGIFAGAVLANGSRPIKALGPVSAWLRSSRLFVCVIVILVGWVSNAIQILSYKRAVNQALAYVDNACVMSGRTLPATNIFLGNENAENRVALFVDFACPACLREFDFWVAKEDESGGRLRLDLYHFPREGLTCGPSGFTLETSESIHHRSCQAALAVECAEQLVPGQSKGINMASLLFRLQGESDMYFSTVNIARQAKVLGIHFDPNNNQDPFWQCMKSPEALATIHRHIKFAFDNGMRRTPEAYIIQQAEDGRPYGKITRIVGGKSKEYFRRFFPWFGEPKDGG